MNRVSLVFISMICVALTSVSGQAADCKGKLTGEKDLGGGRMLSICGTMIRLRSGGRGVDSGKIQGVADPEEGSGSFKPVATAIAETQSFEWQSASTKDKGVICDQLVTVNGEHLHMGPGLCQNESGMPGIEIGKSKDELPEATLTCTGCAGFEKVSPKIWVWKNEAWRHR